MLTARQSRSGCSARRLPGLIAASMVLAIATAGGARAQTASSGPQKHDGKQRDDAGGRAGVDAARGQPGVSLTVAGQRVSVDPATGRLRQPTPEEARRLAEGLREMFSQSADGLEVVQHSNGMLSVDLQGRFQNAAIATVNGGGRIVLHCSHDARTAAGLLSGAAGPNADPAAGAATSRMDDRPAPKRSSRAAEKD